eukprot:766423-Hanusia_phi.AAC.4
MMLEHERKEAEEEMIRLRYRAQHLENELQGWCTTGGEFLVEVRWRWRWRWRWFNRRPQLKKNIRSWWLRWKNCRTFCKERFEEDMEHVEDVDLEIRERHGDSSEGWKVTTLSKSDLGCKIQELENEIEIRDRQIEYCQEAANYEQTMLQERLLSEAREKKSKVNSSSSSSLSSPLVQDEEISSLKSEVDRMRSIIEVMVVCCRVEM